MKNHFNIVNDLGKIKGIGIPKTAFWAIINYCNAVCITCRFYQVPKKSWKYVNYEDARKAIDILYENDFRMISLTGGEPLMNPFVCDICDYINKKGMIITYIPTNGILINNYIAKRLKDADVRLVGISIDMIDKQNMGLTRKIPNLIKVITNARECLENNGIKTYAGILITRQTLDITKILEFVSTMGFDKVIFSYPQTSQLSSFMASTEAENLILNVNEIQRVTEEIKLAKKSSKISIHNPNISLDELVRFFQGAPRKFKCHGGSHLFYLDWNLDLYKCFTLPKRYGNILEMEKIDFKEESCDLCSQQAFRDQDPFYHLAESLKDSKDLLFQGHPITAAKTFLDNDNKDAIKALLEFLKGDFI
jgi:MoaA/NifB/PqqE/SkfB family radical SAM enzyme